MNLINTVNNLGHYAKQALKVVTKPVNTTLALITIGVAISFNSVQAQSNNFKDANMEVTETGYGKLFIKNENYQGISGATIIWTPVDVPGDSIPNPYEFISNNVGILDYEVLVFHDYQTGIQNDYNIEVVQARPNPAADFTLNFITGERPTMPVRITNINGQLIDEIMPTSFVGDVVVYHADLSDRADGFYFATAIIGNEVYTNKLYKIGSRTVGDLGSSAKTKNSSNFKQRYEAVYDLAIEAEGYFTLTDQRIITEGDQGTDFYTLISDEPPPINNQDISGIVTNTNTGNPINNALIEVELVSSGQLYTTTSTSDGSFVIEDLPLNELIIFKAGGVAGKAAVNGFPFTTISEVVSPADSINTHFHVSLPNDVPSSTTLAHVKDQNIHGNNQDTIWFYLGNSFNNTQKNTIRSYFTTLQADEDNTYIYGEKFASSNTGINIEYGSYNTNPYEETIITELGNTLYPNAYANSTMGTAAGYNGFSHEIKRALGYDEVAWAGVDSVMEADAPDFTLEDKDIARMISGMYWNAVYTGKTNIPMEYLAEDMSSGKSNYQNTKDVKARIDELNEIAKNKAAESNIQVDDY